MSPRLLLISRPPISCDIKLNDPDGQWGQYTLLRRWDQEKFLTSLRAAENRPPAKLKADGNRAVIFCSTTDPYQTLKASTPEKTNQLNRALIAMVENALIAIRDQSSLNVRILTRSPLAKKHFDLYQTFGNRLVFGMSIPTLDDALARIYEPRAPAPSLRLRTLREAKEAGLHVFAAMAPTYPECDERDLRRTLLALKELKPITIFHEPINVRAANVARIEAHARKLGTTLNTAVFASDDAWRHYAYDSLLTVQRLAKELDVLHCLHLWPDKHLKTKAHFMRIRRNQRQHLNKQQQKLGHQQDEHEYNATYLPWLQQWWHRVSEWPGKAVASTL